MPSGHHNRRIAWVKNEGVQRRWSKNTTCDSTPRRGGHVPQSGMIDSGAGWVWRIKTTVKGNLSKDKKTQTKKEEVVCVAVVMMEVFKTRRIHEHTITHKKE